MPPPYGGVPKVSLLYAREWRRQGHEVGLVFVYQPGKADDLGAGAKYFFEYPKKPGAWDKVFYLLSWMLRNPKLHFGLMREYLSLNPHFSLHIPLFASYGVQLGKFIEYFKPDVVLLETVLLKSCMAALAARRKDIPIVFDTYAEIHEPTMGENARLSDAERAKYWSGMLDMAEYTICISNCAVGALRYLSRDKVKVFHDTCDFSLCRSELGETRKEMRQKLGLPESRFLVGAVGAFEYRKGHHHLIEAMSVLAKQGLDIGVAICGGSGDPEKWRKLAADFGVGDRVYLLQRIPEIDLVRFYRSLDLYANLSNTPRSCGLDLALLEAMASGLPIVVYDNGGLPEAVPEGRNGWLVKTDDMAGVARALSEALEKTVDQLAEMGRVSAEIAAKYDIAFTSYTKAGWLQEAVERFNLKKSESTVRF